MIQTTKLTDLKGWWSRQPKVAFALWIATVGVFLYNGSHTEGCFREYFGVQSYRAGKTDQMLDSVVKTVENQQQWTYELSHPPADLSGNYGPERQKWLSGIGTRATQRSDDLVNQIRGTMQDKADHPYPTVRCGQ